MGFNKALSNHVFQNGYCKYCGSSIGFPDYISNGCSELEQQSHDKHKPFLDFLKHEFEFGSCKNCGWSYDFARFKNEICPKKRKKANYEADDFEESYKNEKHHSKNSTSSENSNFSDPRKQYAEILNLSTKPTVSEIRKNYRQLSKKYHPDRVASLGDEFQDLAELKMKKINEAYNWFKKKHEF